MIITFPLISLLQILKSKEIYAARTIRVNRFANPPLLFDKDLKKKGIGSRDEVTTLKGDVVVFR